VAAPGAKILPSIKDFLDLPVLPGHEQTMNDRIAPEQPVALHN
jgi:hypothetical protein